MNHYQRFSFFILFAIVSLPNLSADVLDDFVESQIKERRIPGLSLAVIREGKVIRAAGYGMANLEHQVSATKDTVYEIGSISKQFAAEAIMLLVEDGKLKLEDPITKHLPSNASKAWDAIRIRDLLRHTTGLKDWTEVKEFSYRRQYTPEEFIDLVREFPLEFQPNDNWRYSNTNLPLIGIVIEQTTGQKYEQFVTDRILHHFMFPSIRFHDQHKIISQRASGYVLRNDQLEHGEPFRPKIIASSGGVLANAVDLAQWWEANLNGKLLKRDSLEELLSPTKLSDGRSVAHGLSIFFDSFNGHKMIHHHGSTVGGFGSVVRHFPIEKLTIAVIGNLEDGGWGAEYISKRVADHYIPGCFIGGLSEIEDEVGSKIAEAHLSLLQEIAEHKTSEMLATQYAPKITKEFREKTAKNISTLKRFVYLGKESIGGHHFVLDNGWTEASYFKMTTADRILYYHFRCYDGGKVGLVFAED
jgi:D-alanyl-D-alanine carboxypeptidase